MQETIIKGTGNSRTLASVPNFLSLYPTYEAFAKALMDRELPIDIGPLNSAGLLQKGTDLNKPNLLSDETAALYTGLPEDPTVNDVLAKLGPVLKSAGNVVSYMATYTGTGATGSWNQGNPTYAKMFTFPHTPLVVFCGEDGGSFTVTMIYGQPQFRHPSYAGSPTTVAWSTKGVSWYSNYGSNYVQAALNRADIKYFLLALLDKTK